MKNILVFSLIIISVLRNYSIAQTFNLYVKNEALNPNFQVDTKEISILFNNNNTHQTYIRGAIFDAGITEKENLNSLENWVRPYSLSTLNCQFNVYPNTNQLGINANITNSITKKEIYSNKKLTRSFLFVFVKEPDIIKFLDQNLSYFSLERIDTIDFSIYMLNNISNLDDFKSKCNQLIYNLGEFEIPIAPKIEIPKNLYFEINASTSILNVNTKGFNGFATKELNINVLHKLKESTLSVGAGISYMQSNFLASDKATYSSTNSLILDTTYAAINNLTQNYAQQTISLSGLVRYRPKIGENNLSISISPFISIYNRLSSEISGGSITTFGKYAGISEYVYNVDELGLFSKSEELVGQRIGFNSSAYGINLGIGYQLNLKHFLIVPTLAIKYISIQNKNEIKESYSIDSQSYFGKFATLPKTTFISPLIGLSIIF